MVEGLVLDAVYRGDRCIEVLGDVFESFVFPEDLVENGFLPRRKI